MSALTFTVYGKSEPQGSARAFRRGSRVIVTSDNPKLHDWRQQVATQAQIHAVGQPLRLGPVALDIAVYLPRPKSLPKKGRPPVTRPDLDKLVRAIGDALTGVLYRDDSQIVHLTARKFYAEPDGVPRVQIRVDSEKPSVSGEKAGETW